MDDTMAQIREDFLTAYGNEYDKRQFKLFYSHLHPFPLMILGLNPGGDPEKGELLGVSECPERGEHDYVAFRHHRRYPLARKMCDLLEFVLPQLLTERLSDVPKANVSFFRSRNAASHPDMVRSVDRSRPFLVRMLKIVEPSFLLCEGLGTARFLSKACTTWERVCTESAGWFDDRKICEKYHAQIADLSAPTCVLAFPHPTGYPWSRKNWQRLRRYLGKELRSVDFAQA